MSAILSSATSTNSSQPVAAPTRLTGLSMALVVVSFLVCLGILSSAINLTHLHDAQYLCWRTRRTIGCCVVGWAVGTPDRRGAATAKVGQGHSRVDGRSGWFGSTSTDSRDLWN